MENLNVVFSPRSVIKPLSSREFQEMLNLWFEEKGVLRELRLQLRFKLVNLLKDTIIGKDICKGGSQGISLSDQAVNLIVAEYLMRNNCYYSLSVFNSEATFTNILPKSIISNEKLKETDLYNLHFDRQNILQILELIGVARNTVYCDRLLSMYFNEQNTSILRCLVTLICQPPDVNSEINCTNLFKHLQTMCVGPCDEIYFLEKIEELLSYINVPNDHAKKVSQSIQSFYRIRNEQDKKELLTLVNQQNIEIVSKNKKIAELHKSKNILQNHLLKTNRYYKKTKAHLANLLQEENLLKRNVSQKSINIDCPNIKCNDLIGHDVKPNISSVLNPEDMICQLPHCSDICKKNIQLAEDLLKENNVLKKENREQKESLKKLFLIYKDVLGKFNNCQSKLNFLNSRVDKGLNEELINNFLNGENLNVEAQSQQNSDGSDASSVSLTEEILQEARVKLQKLEDETKEIEDKFRHIRFT